jgi:fructosamine-3-kinase
MKKITFLNQPKFSKDETDQPRNKKKVELIPKFEEYISNHKLFKDKEVNVSFAQEGRTSLVAIIETEGKKYVLKASVASNLMEKEGVFLKVWEEDRVSVPHVIEDGILDQGPYTLMGFVDADILSNVYSEEEMISRKIFVELGSVLSKMHTRDVGSHNNEEFLNFAATRLAYIKEHSILNDGEHGSITRAIDIIQHYVISDNRSTYCHNDFAPYNAFATNPITIFDPSPGFNHPYIDLGLAIVLMVSMYDSEVIVPQLIEGYFGNKTIDPKVLHAFVVFNSHRRIPRWHMTNRPERIIRMQEYLKKNKNLLDL